VSERLVRALRWGAGLLILGFVVLQFRRNWDEMQSQPIAWTFRPLPALASVAVVWAMYVMLIEAWRRMLAGWGQRLAPGPAARIWVLSSLGKYIPGKVWAIAGMALMARDAGVAPWAATASAVLLQALAVGTGAMVSLFFGGALIEAERPGLVLWFWLGGAAAFLGVLALLFPPVTRRLLALARIAPDREAPGTGPILLGVVANLAAWIGYGVSFWLLATAVLPGSVPPIAAGIAAFAASYVAGLVFLLAPGGLLVREGLLFAMLHPSIGAGPAAALAVASRILLTITELGAAVPFLLFRWGRPSAA
jgi:uncharacterized membrane protein YbhN (UPF0104 family)